MANPKNKCSQTTANNLGCIEFVKMHGAGNDYIYLDGINNSYRDLPELSRRISHRQFGIGSDGLVVILPSDIADFRMRMFNADGSEAEMCGNASRCIGKYVYERGFTDKTEVTLETLAGIKVLHLHIDSSGKVKSVTVDMGRPKVFGEVTMQIPAGDFSAVSVSMGNPHGVLFTDNLSDTFVIGNGPAMECAPCWPEKANIEFVDVKSPGEAVVRVWERGSGITLACGTGACATLAAGVTKGLLARKADIRLPGGTLTVEWDRISNHIFLTGEAHTTAEGIYFTDPGFKI